MSSVLAKLFPSTPILTEHSRTLYQVLSRLPKDGVGARVAQTRWAGKGIHGCYWEVTKARLKCEGTHGKAWGRLIWRGSAACAFLRAYVLTLRTSGKVTTKYNKEIRKISGGLKYLWRQVPGDASSIPSAIWTTSEKTASTS
jgi:hypothetical protein